MREKDRRYGRPASPSDDRPCPNPVNLHTEPRRPGVTLELLHLEPRRQDRPYAERANSTPAATSQRRFALSTMATLDGDYAIVCTLIDWLRSRVAVLERMARSVGSTWYRGLTGGP